MSKYQMCPYVNNIVEQFCLLTKADKTEFDNDKEAWNYLRKFYPNMIAVLYKWDGVIVDLNNRKQYITAHNEKFISQQIDKTSPYKIYTWVPVLEGDTADEYIHDGSSFWDDRMEETEKWFKSDAGKAALKEVFDNIEKEEKKFDDEVEELHNKLTSKKKFKTHLFYVIQGVKNKIKYFNKHHNGYEPNEKGELCELSPTHDFSVLSGYFAKYGKDTYESYKEDFLSDSYTMHGYTIKTYQGQGSFYRLYFGDKQLFQI